MINQISKAPFKDFNLPNGGYFKVPQNQASESPQVTEAEKEQKTRNLGIKIAGIALITGFLTLGITRGVATKRIQKFLEKIQKTTDSNTVREKAGKFINKLEPINNFTSYKDYAVKKMMDKPKWLRNIHQGITDAFEKVGFNTVQSAYRKTDKKASNFSRYLDSILKEKNLNNTLLVENSVKSKLEMLGSSTATEGRLKSVKSAMEKLEKNFEVYFKEKKLSKAVKNVSEDFVAERLASGDKIKLAESISSLKKPVIDEVNMLLKVCGELNAGGKITNSEFAKIQKKAASMLKSLDKSTNLESGSFFDKSRDWVLGTAPTDVISVVAALGMFGYGLKKADNRDERVSLTIKYGIPALGAIATSLYCTARLVAGGKALVFGLLSGFAMNKAGVYVDRARKKQLESLKNPSEQPLQKKILKEVVNQIQIS